MSDRYLILADGTRLFDSEAGYADGNLWCWLKGYTFAQAFQLFSDMEKIKEITFVYGSMKTIFSGASVLQAIITRNDTMTVNLTGDIHVESDISMNEAP